LNFAYKKPFLSSSTLLGNQIGQAWHRPIWCLLYFILHLLYQTEDGLATHYTSSLGNQIGQAWHRPIWCLLFSSFIYFTRPRTVWLPTKIETVPRMAGLVTLNSWLQL